MRVLRVLPRWAPMAAITIARVVFARRDVSAATLAHEEIHVHQQRRDGLRFYVRYVFSVGWRVRYEAEAYAVSVRIGSMTLDQAARALAGPLYLWPCSIGAARAAILTHA